MRAANSISSFEDIFSILQISSSILLISLPILFIIFSTSGILGVIRVHLLNNSFIMYSRSLFLDNSVPEVELSTGSSTTFFILYLSTVLQTTSIIFLSGSMPIFTASGRISDKTASSCFSTNAGSTFITADTPSVF